MSIKKNTGIIISAILYIVFGVILVRYPDQALNTVCLGLGILTMVFGVTKLLAYVFKKDAGILASLDLILGIILTAVALLLLIRPGVVVSIIPFIAGMVILFQSISRLQQAVELKVAGYDKWWSMLVIGIITLFLGGYIVMNPFDTVALMVRAIGVVLIINGVLSLAGTGYSAFDMFYTLKNRNKGSHEAHKEPKVEIVDQDGNVIR